MSAVRYIQVIEHVKLTSLEDLRGHIVKARLHLVEQVFDLEGQIRSEMCDRRPNSQKPSVRVDL